MDALAAWAERTPAKIALQMAGGGSSLTYAELDNRVDRMAHALRRMKLAEGATVAFMSGNDVRTLELWWGARRAGLYYVPVSSKLRPDELGHILTDSRAAMLVIGPAADYDAADLQRVALPRPD